MESKISIIGGSGFVGTNLCRELEYKGYDFEIIDLKSSLQFSSHYKYGDVRNIESLRTSITGEVLIVLAAVHRDDVSDSQDYIKTNVNGAENISMVAKEKGISKIIFTSSVAIYGFTNSITTEDGEKLPFNDYGKTKLAAEHVFGDWSKDSNGELIIVRSTVIFGEGNRGNVFNLFQQIASRKFFMIGTGENKKSMAYIGNLVAFLIACIDLRGQSGTFNYVDSPTMSMNELVTLVRRELFGKASVGFRVPKFIGLLAGAAFDLLAIICRRSFTISSIRVKKFTADTEFTSNQNFRAAFTPPYTLEQGIQRTLQSGFVTPDPNCEIFYTE